LTYKGKQWEENENGQWVDYHYLLMTSRYVKGGLTPGQGDTGGVWARFTVAWGAARRLKLTRDRGGYGQCKIGHAAWDEFDDRVLTIKMRRHTNPTKFTSSVIDIIVKFHLDLLAMVVRVKSQVERLMVLDSR
jgi:hypothetical protein